MSEVGPPGDGRNEWYHSLLDATSEIVVVIADSGEIRYANAAIERVLGYDPEAVVGESALTFVADTDREHAATLLAAAADESRPIDPPAPLRIRNADGGYQYLEIVTPPKTDFAAVDGTVVALRSSAPDGGRESELATYETVIETAPMGLFTLDETGVVTWANDVFADTLGIERSELIGIHYAELVERGFYDQSVIDRYVDRVRTLLSSKNDVERVDYEVETHLGNETLVHDAHIALLPMTDGEFRGTVIAFRDVTQQRTYEAELERQNERLDAFASMVSHDLRNPLSVARGRAELALETGDLSHVEEIVDAHDRMESIIEGLLSLARNDDTVENPVDVDLDDVVETAWQVVESPNGCLELADTTTLPADPARLQQVLENLLRNSVEHGGEDVTVRVGVLEDGAGFYVEDDGSGIDEDDCDRVFDQGYSTGEDGTGLGLAIVDTIADAHGWSVRATESESGGARFEIATGTAGGSR